MANSLVHVRNTRRWDQDIGKSHITSDAINVNRGIHHLSCLDACQLLLEDIWDKRLDPMRSMILDGSYMNTVYLNGFRMILTPIEDHVIESCTSHSMTHYIIILWMDIQRSIFRSIE